MKGKKLISAALAAALLPLLSAPLHPSAEAGQGKEEKRVPLRWLSSNDAGAKPLQKGDRIVEEIQKKLGIKLIVDQVPQDGQEKLNLEMASADMPDLVTSAFGSSSTQTWIDKGLLVPLNDYLPELPDMKKQLEGELKWTANEDDGLFYGMPFITQYDKANTCLIFRKDWLDKLHLSYPKNFEEVEKVFDAFTNGDPDGNGQNDTVALTMQKPIGDWSWVFAGFGRKYADYALDKDGKIIPTFETPEFKAAMTWIKKICDAGYVDQDFVLNDMKAMEEKFFQGKAGAYNAPLFRHVSRIEGSLRALHPEASVAYGPIPEGPAGRGNSPQGKAGFFTAVTTHCKNPEKAAAFINFMISEEGQQLLRLGIEGIHYEKKDGKIVYNEEERAKDSFSPNGWAHALAWGSFFWPLESGYLPETEPERERALETVEIASKDQVPNLVKRVTRAEAEHGKELKDIYEQAFISMLHGEIDIDEGVKALSEEWRAAGGEEVLQAAQKAYEEQEKK